MYESGISAKRDKVIDENCSPADEGLKNDTTIATNGRRIATSRIWAMLVLIFLQPLKKENIIYHTLTWFLISKI